MPISRPMLAAIYQKCPHTKADISLGKSRFGYKQHRMLGTVLRVPAAALN